MLNDFPVGACLAVSDIDRARRFYEDTLGMKVASDRPDGVLYDSGGTQFLVYPSQFAGTNQATAASWLVDDVDATVAELRERGVTFEEYDFPGLKTENGIAAFDGGKAAWFKDPDGNILSVGDMA